MSIARAVLALESLSMPQLDEIIGLNLIRSSFQWEGIVDSIRSAVLYGEHQGYWKTTDEIAWGVHETADHLVPEKAAQRVGELAAISAAWRTDLAAFRPYAERYEEWHNTDLVTSLDGGQLDSQIGRALYLAYTDGVLALVEWAFARAAETDGER